MGKVDTHFTKEGCGPQQHGPQLGSTGAASILFAFRPSQSSGGQDVAAYDHLLDVALFLAQKYQYRG